MQCLMMMQFVTIDLQLVEHLQRVPLCSLELPSQVLVYKLYGDAAYGHNSC